MFKRVLIANRAEIANRIIKTLKKMEIESVTIYSEADKHASFVMNSDITVALNGTSLDETYLDYKKIIKICKEYNVDAIHPGYGFLSENVNFVQACEDNGIVFIGPNSKHIEDFGLKHTARQIAKDNDVPLLEGSELLSNIEEAKATAKNITYPVMLKSTAGGGGIGMKLCFTEQELVDAYDGVIKLAGANFSNNGVFLEKYIQTARHIEVQIFGDGLGNIKTLGERDCSIQRRNQKVIEETPAPNITDELREQLFEASYKLAKAVDYKSAGTVEYIYDTKTDKFYFLEVNTRLQVEHGITEEVCGVDLVEWMIRIAAGDNKPLLDYKHAPKGHAIEVRVYAEDGGKNFQPSTGIITKVQLPSNTRCDTWIEDGCEVSPFYDPLLLKLITVSPTREENVLKLQKALEESKIYGIESNLSYLSAIAKEDFFTKALFYTKVLDTFSYNPCKVDVIKSGTLTTIQDYPARQGFWNVGIPPSGAMDNLTPRLLNKLLNNKEDASFIEMTFIGATYKFRQDSVIAIGGANMAAKLNGEEIESFKAIKVNLGDTLEFKKVIGDGNRTYLAIQGGFDTAKYLGSSSTFTLGEFGGHAGRALKAGDVLSFSPFKEEEFKELCEVPTLNKEWEIGVVYGPHGSPDFFTKDDIEEFFNASWEVHFNSSRTGVRLIGPAPKWARSDGGDAGLHPSNIHDNAYAFGSIDFTGDMPVILGPDGPSLGGFVCPATIISCELYKIGQLKAGDTIKFKAVSLENADLMTKACETAIENNTVLPKLDDYSIDFDANKATPIIETFKYDELDIDIAIRAAGNEFILIEAGELKLDIELRFFIHALMTYIEEKNLSGIVDLTPGIRSLQIHFNTNIVSRNTILNLVKKAVSSLKDIENLEVDSRTVWLPLSWNDPSIQIAIDKYQQGVRPNAPWCPSNIDFIKRINGLQNKDEVKNIVFDADYLVMGLGDVYLGAPVATPLNPSHRVVTTKYNPARTWTAQNSVGIGGAYMCVYGMEGPGGYQLFGRTLQMWNTYRQTKEFTNPWLLRFFDQVKFYPVTTDELHDIREKFLYGKFPLTIEDKTFKLKEYKEFLKANEEKSNIFQTKRANAFETERLMWKEKGLDSFDTKVVAVEDKDELILADDEEAIESIMSGNIWKIEVKVGDKVKAGEVLVILESMKMEVEIETEVSGVVSQILYKEGDNIESGNVLVVLKKDEK
ncbi:urea carboxylase [Poseidonibacter lekithochrous]|uniref:urea carboxylase n=1 Tax=Poseidonibacter TaxID=2321187 RepID=UPI001C080B21|nr:MULTISPECIES: urea carboxylase [Poseidonibacter]MBU3015829.1 urea carboxylase [Poseidonibacter lekithochrous]MDO6829128.1 urea carboxylase [Poseidonibacter sp. 1_MG-2023]